ncbi:unnamed protein product [Parascedosporium putredinis]|uniref:Ribonuclease P/MRP protein subunit POP5 n=1 Tax=Parascedosporium putredinis TaxID=1442378 RepID=A0A9P1GUR8_9PEZI|nr:unnamed protein product [Parascedosporium putredinis]CAI7987711.1 unnamed protein product [Parascedosporium putredinis]
MVRTKERYLLVNILYPPDSSRPTPAKIPGYVALHRPTVDNLTAQALARGIKIAVTSLFGDYGSGVVESNLSVKYLSRATSTFIVKTSRSQYRMVWAALTLMDQIPVSDGSSCIFRVVRVSGTIRKAEQEAIRRARQLILAAKADSESGSLSSVFGQPGNSETVDLMDDVMDESSSDSGGDGD